MDEIWLNSPEFIYRELTKAPKLRAHFKPFIMHQGTKAFSSSLQKYFNLIGQCVFFSFLLNP